MRPLERTYRHVLLLLLQILRFPELWPHPGSGHHPGLHVHIRSDSGLIGLALRQLHDALRCHFGGPGPELADRRCNNNILLSGRALDRRSLDHDLGLLRNHPSDITHLLMPDAQNQKSQCGRGSIENVKKE